MIPSLETLITNHRLSQVHGLRVLTDRVDYPDVDQVFPMYPEQPFFLEELDKIGGAAGAEVLEIGLGSGVLSIGALKAGARRVTALEINSRAKLFAGFNALINGVTQGLAVIDGDHEDLWRPVRGRRFDLVISNPPFMPSPPGDEHYFHSGGGDLLGIDFLDRICRELDAHLMPNGEALIVTAAPGDDQLPTAFIDVIERRLSGGAGLIVDPIKFSFDVVKHHTPDGLADATMRHLGGQLKQIGLTHEHLCVLHYEKTGSGLTVEQSEPHAAWDEPLPA